MKIGTAKIISNGLSIVKETIDKATMKLILTIRSLIDTTLIFIISFKVA
jgi:hypothetical protein